MKRFSGYICSADINGQNVTFFVTNPNDSIQRHHFAGEFYEKEELQIISHWFAPGGLFVDIGANVGNHTIFIGKYLNPRQVIVFEPNPIAIPILRFNLALNGLRFIVDTSYLGRGLSDVKGRAAIEIPENNLGGAHFIPSESANGFEKITGDSVLGSRSVDFLKIDVEGMELKVLDGLKQTIARCRPRIFVEVDNTNTSTFHDWCSANNYVVCQRAKRYEVNENYVVIPREQSISAAPN